MIHQLCNKIREWDDAYFYWVKGVSPYHKAFARLVGKSMIAVAAIGLATLVYNEESKRAADRNETTSQIKNRSVIERLTRSAAEVRATKMR